jgi:hypothetical protein
MAYVLKNETGAIVGVFARPQYVGHELISDSHPDILAFLAARQAEMDADAANRKTLRDQIMGATEAQWLALTDTQRQKVILKALKYVARNL